MNIDTGHLVDITGMSQDELLQLAGRGYTEVPPSLNRAARRALAGKKETSVNLDNDSRLARWAAIKRAERDDKAKQKARRKMAKQSRRRNRGR